MICYLLSTSSGFESDALGQLIEVCCFLEDDGDFGVDGLRISLVHVLLSDLVDDCVSVLGKNLGKFEDERNAFSHTLNLHTAVLFDDELGEEETLVELAGPAHSVHVGLVEF